MKLREHPLLKPHLGKPLLLDSNVLFLFLAVPLHPELINTKRLSMFTEDDYILLSEIVKIFPTVCTTPHVLTEVSNLANALTGNHRSDWINYYCHKIQTLFAEEEKFQPAASIVTELSFMRFGLTDAALANLSRTHLVLTIDFPLSNLLESRNLNVINFSHIRTMLF